MKNWILQSLKLLIIAQFGCLSSFPRGKAHVQRARMKSPAIFAGDFAALSTLCQTLFQQGSRQLLFSTSKKEKMFSAKWAREKMAPMNHRPDPPLNDSVQKQFDRLISELNTRVDSRHTTGSRIGKCGTKEPRKLILAIEAENCKIIVKANE